MAITSLAVAFAGVLLAFAIHLWLRFGRAQAEIRQLTADLRFSNDVLDVAPCGYVAWTADGHEHVSPGLGTALGIGSMASTWSAVRTRLADEDRVVIDDALAGLWRHGVPFNLSTATSLGERVILVTGTRQRRADNYVDVLWLQDATMIAANGRQLSAESTALAGEVARLRTLLDALPFPVWQRTRDLQLLFCNRSYAEAADAPTPVAAVMLEKELAQSAIEREGKALAERARRVGSTQSESHHVVIGGARRLLEFTELPMGSGFIAGYARDYTDVEGVQADLGRHIDAQAKLLDHIQTGIAIFDPERRLTFFNRRYANLWGLDPEWLQTGPELGEIVELLRERRRLPEVADYRAWRQGRLALFGSVIVPREEYLYLPDETSIREIVAPHPLGGLMFIQEDVTDRLALERSYNELTAVQRQTVNELHEGIAVYGTDGRLKLGNPAFLRHWQLTQEDLEHGIHIADVIDRNRSIFVPNTPWDAFKARMINDVMERRGARGRIVRTDDKVLDYATVPLPDGSALYSETDVTDTYNIEKALLERNQALQEADRLKTEFLANVSYELRTPLNTIIGFAEILSNGYFGEMNNRQTEYCRGILEASQRLLSLINDILDLAMVEAGQIMLELDRFDVSTMLSSVLNLARERARKQNLRIVLNCAPNVGSVVADERRIKQVVFNLVSNAVKFTPAGGTVTVEARRVEGELVVQIVDTGVGILKEDMQRVFEAFERGRPGENRPIGAGLGLTLVKRFIEMHGGRLDLDSTPGQGTVVSCYLPVDGAAVETTSVHAA